MLCPKCQRENFRADKPCPRCGFRRDANQLDELDALENFKMDAPPVFGLKAIQIEPPEGTQARPPAYTADEAKNAWIELAQLEILFEKVDEWRTAGYFKTEMEGLDPVKMQRARADELRQRLEGQQRSPLNPSAQDRLKTVSFLMDAIDLLDSREWFNKAELEKVVGPVLAMIADAMSHDEPE